MAISCSIVIPTRNRPKQLSRCIDCVLSQSRLPTEIIVVDDCSTAQGGLDQILAARQNEQVGIWYHRLEQHQGASNARNMGASLASGEILMFLDDDDFWEPTKIETQLRIFQSNPKAGLVYTGTLITDDTDGGRVLHASRDHLSGEAWPCILFRNFIGPTSAAAIRRCLFDQVGGFDPQLPALQDYDLWLRVSLAAPIIYDGAHNLHFPAGCQHRTRISSVIFNYRVAFDRVSRKYEHRIAELSFWQRRQFHAQHLLLLAGKHFEQSEYVKCAMLLLRGVFLHPHTLLRVARSALSRTVAGAPHQL